MVDFVIRRCGGFDAGTLQHLRLAMLDDSPQSYRVDSKAARRKPASYWQEWAGLAAEGDTKAVFFAFSPVSPTFPTFPAFPAFPAFPVGMIAADIADGVAHVGALWVDPEWRNQGVAGLLLDGVEAWASSRASVAELGVAEDNPANKLYLARGYRFTGERNSMSGGRVELVMNKALFR